MTTNKLVDRNVLICGPPPARFSLKEWHLNNRVKYRFTEDQLQLANRTLIECDRRRELAEEQAKLNKAETNHHLAQRIEDIEFCKRETENVRKEVCLEIEALETYKERIMDAMESIKSEALRLCRKCIILREGRLGIDLVADDVEIELLKECAIIEGAQSLLRRTLEKAHEQVRRLRSTIYFMDRDLEDKTNALKIDKHNALLKETSLNLSMYHGVTPLDVSNITVEEWETITKKNFEAAAKEKNSGISLRSYVDTLLKQIIEDLWNQYNTTNNAFKRRIQDLHESKKKLEEQHYEVLTQISEMTRNITRLEVAIAEKEGFMALAHTRLGFRAQREGLELCKDIVETKLVNEVHHLVFNVAGLQHMLTEAQASLRYLLKTQVQLEEDINLKVNSIKIDEVDCMTIRESMDYHAY